MVNADFLHSDVWPVAKIDGVAHDKPSRFVNRELSWLAFNWRVLEEAQNPDLPLLERVRMLSISSSNLDEFYSVRVAGLRELADKGIRAPSFDGLVPEQQLLLIDSDANQLINEQQATWRMLLDDMAKENITVLAQENWSEDDRAFLAKYFERQIFPVLSPLAVDPAHPFPFIANGGLTLALKLRNTGNGKMLKALLPIPNQIERFIKLPSEDEGTVRLVSLDSVLLEFLQALFPGYELAEHCSFRVLRDSDLEIEDEAEDLVREFETALKRRRRGVAVRLEVTAGAPSDLRMMILNELDVTADEVFDIDGFLGLSDVSAVIMHNRRDLEYPVFTPRIPERVQDFEGDIFAAIRQKDMLLHHPYESFDIVVRFLNQAARDPNVVAIKQTIYRTSNESSIVDALCAAAEEGKSVTALVELRARFDEAANIRVSRRLERAGAQVVYGFLDLKTHAKISTVVRREGADLRTYTHIGTGNYHPITANVYTDLSLFSCSNSLGQDAAKVFNYVSGYAQPVGLKKLSVAPLFMKDDLLAAIANEAEIAKSGGEGTIWAKMNSVVDPEVIDALYAASAAGVKIELVVRGICGLRPGVEGLSENIRVKSVVGRFLEHSRIVCFGNGAALPNKKAKVHISSADWMGRNLNGRVETLCRITNKTVAAQIMSQIMAANLADQQNSWVMQADGSYDRHSAEDGERLFSCHSFFMETPSLSGRGKVGHKDVPELTHSYSDD